jgi:ABC-type multidrug transport system ATPase subunit
VAKKTFKPSTKKRIQLTFQNLTVKSIQKKKKFLFCEYGEATPQKIILENVSGTIIPGQFVAILGSSGSGKTTFLNFLSGRTVGLGDSLKMGGKVLINGKDRDKMPGSEALSCYVQ